MISVEMLSRLQFAFTISFHILFPAFSIGLSIFLVVMEGLWLKTKNQLYLNIAKFWTKIFALTFGMGVISGIVMEFQLGTNWAGMTAAVGGVLGPLFTYEVLTAFFIEAGFLGVMLFGWNKVGAKLHYLSTVLVFIGTTLSAYWIMSANSWMQHPVGYEVINGSFRTTSWMQIIFNSYNYIRFIHMVLASYICAGFVIISVCSYYILKQQHIDFAKKCLTFCWIALLIIMPIQLIVGDLGGIKVYKNQPLKTAAIEGIWDTSKSVPLLLFAIPNQSKQRNDFEIGIPYLSSLLNAHSIDAELIGLKSVSPKDQPQMWPIFYAFRIMVALGVVMSLLAVTACYLLKRQRLFINKNFLKLSVLSAPIGFIALWTGWLVAEIGRQPWVVYGMLRTTEAVSKVDPHDVIISMALILVVYGLIFGYFYTYYFHRTVVSGPDMHDDNSHQAFSYMNASANEELK